MVEMTFEEIERRLGQKIKLVSEKTPKKYKKADVGEQIKIANIEWVVLDKDKNGNTLCLALEDVTYVVYGGINKFDARTTNYAESNIRKMLNSKILRRITNDVGKNGLLDIEIDLTALDGRNCFGKVVDKVGLLTYDMYRKYVSIIRMNWHKAMRWWLATPWTTSEVKWSHAVCCVGAHGDIEPWVCFRADDYRDFVGTCPICYFSSSVFED